LLLDEVFPGRRLGTMTWRTRQGSNADQQCFLSVDHEHVLVYGNAGFSFNGFTKSYEMYANPDQDPRGDWRMGAPFYFCAALQAVSLYLAVRHLRAERRG